MDKPVCQPCLRNQEPICNCLAEHFVEKGKVLELASGTGQHCVYFAQRLPHLIWQSSELADNLGGIRAWISEAGLNNTPSPIPLDINQDHWPNECYDYAFCANLLHFVSADTVQTLFTQVAKVLKQDGLLACYGPINEHGYTSEGNRQLDTWLKQDIHPDAGIKEIDSLCSWATEACLNFFKIERLPANNVIVLFHKK